MTQTPQEFVATRNNRRQALAASRGDRPRLGFEAVTAVALGAVTALACVAGQWDITR